MSSVDDKTRSVSVSLLTTHLVVVMDILSLASLAVFLLGTVPLELPNHENDGEDHETGQVDVDLIGHFEVSFLDSVDDFHLSGVSTCEYRNTSD